MPSSANIPHSLCHQDNRTDKSVIKTRSCCFVFNAPVSPPQPWSHFTAKLGWLRLTRQLPFFFFFTTPSHAASCWTEVTFYAILFIKLYSWPDEGGRGSSFHSKFYDISFFFCLLGFQSVEENLGRALKITQTFLACQEWNVGILFWWATDGRDIQQPLSTGVSNNDSLGGPDSGWFLSFISCQLQLSAARCVWAVHLSPHLKKNRKWQQFFFFFQSLLT